MSFSDQLSVLGQTEHTTEAQQFPVLEPTANKNAMALTSAGSIPSPSLSWVGQLRQPLPSRTGKMWLKGVGRRFLVVSGTYPDRPHLKAPSHGAAFS